MKHKAIRWLHLSDFHIGKDVYGQGQIFKYLLKEIAVNIASGNAPDLVFITGDIANSGLDREYDIYITDFLYPLMELLQDKHPARIFIVPGNHDVDRSKAKAVRKHDVLSTIPRFLDPTSEGLHERMSLFPRFDAYIRADLPDAGGKWIRSPEGAYVDFLDTHGYRVGILGLNTAWLSENNEDRHRLSPGKWIIEQGLELLKGCDVRIALGHHPIDWFIDDEVDPICALFAQNNVIYLHGHLHKNQSSRKEGSGYQFLSIQAGAAFQSREDELWINRLLWSELDVEKHRVVIKPRQWSRANQEWQIDPSFPEDYRISDTDSWALSLPESKISGSLEHTPEDNDAKNHLPFILPAGWLLINKEFLSQHNQSLPTKRLIRYFDGRVPTWQDAMSSQIPKRDIVKEIVSSLTSPDKPQELKVTLLLGAGGEGKSTALRQIICALVESRPSLKVLWHNNSSTALPIEFLLDVSQSDSNWLIASDDADLIAKNIYEAVVSIHEASRNNIQFLLSCRDTDWKGAKGDQLPWGQFVNYSVKRLRGLSLEDARSIVESWGEYGNEAMGKLQGMIPEEAAQRLVKESKSETYAEEGAFLGAMLRARFGKGMKEHVKSLLLRLNGRTALNTTLMDAFAYIAALHAENIHILSKEVLAETIGCKPGQIRREIIGPLGEEAAATTISRCVITRHRAIAETAMEILLQDFDFDFDDIFIKLVQAAQKVYESSKSALFRPGEWKYLSAHFFQKGNKALGITLARSLYDMSPSDPFLINQLARMLREVGEAEQSIQLFETASKAARKDRSLYLEWAIAESQLGRIGITAWLAGVALSDSTEMNPINTQQALHSMNGLAFSLNDLFEKHNDIIFIEAASAAVQLGLAIASMLSPGPKRENGELFLKRNQLKSKQAGINSTDPPTALKRLIMGVSIAWEKREADLPYWIRRGDELNFRNLARLLRIDSV